jgi:hypothetical protein
MKNNFSFYYVATCIMFLWCSASFFGETGKQECERVILRAFLRCLKISFEAKEIKSIKSQFPDVQFRSHEFEIKGNAQLSTTKAWHLNDLKRTTKLSDLFETYTPH